MAVSEQTIQEAIRDTIGALEAFSPADVTINDWDVLDQSTQGGPYVVVEDSDEWESRQDTVTATDDYNVPFTLVEPVDPSSWKRTMDNFRDHRQQIVNGFNVAGSTVRSASGQAGIDIQMLRSDGPIGYIYPPGIDPEYQASATPIFVTQRIVAVCKEF